MNGEHEHIKEKYGLARGFGLLHATALNMSNMVGVGPFITIPLIIAAMGGPQAMIGWVLGTALAVCDGLVWSELAAAMPGSGGTYLYLRESFQNTRWGRLLPFLFIWQFIISGPLEIASGYIGFAQYLSYFWRSMGPVESKLVALGLAVLLVILLYRRITAIARLTVVLWIGMLITVSWVIGSGLLNFDARLAFDFPPNAWSFSLGFLLGLGGAMRIAMYDFLGYYDVCYIGGEIRQPERVIPRAIIISVILVALIYSGTNLSIIGVVPWREAMQSPFIVSTFMERLYGNWAGAAVTILILWASFASVFALMLGYSRVPYAAALDGYFFSVFSRLHPSGAFPHISLLTMGVLSMIATLFTLGWVIDALLVGRILIQFVGQIAAVHWIRRHRPDIERPFRIWLYPLPSLVALPGWLFLFGTAEPQFVLFGLGTLLAGAGAFWLWRIR
ncbi:MAG TPA: APC family permease [Bryobacteraceae bacterium]|nr:APC family permease [Bryobacteraceae bacterium]